MDIGYRSRAAGYGAVSDTISEKLAAFMLRNGFATGHGETVGDLLSELEWQVKERDAKTLRACAKLCRDYGERAMAAHPSAQEAGAAARNLTDAIEAMIT